MAPVAIGRIIIVILLIPTVILGYLFIRDHLEAKKKEEFRKYARVIAEISVAAELYREDNEGFLAARDSILSDEGLTLDSLDAFRDRLQDDKREWVKIWDQVKEITDSLVDFHQERLKALPDSSADSTAGR